MPSPFEAIETGKQMIPDKAERYGEGPWVDESDLITYRDPETALWCSIQRMSHSGHLNGYAAIPQGHPYHGKDYDVIDTALNRQGVYIHGGLTYAGKGGRDGLWWVGFDTAHSQDFAPAYSSFGKGVYRDAEYVRAELVKLAKALFRARGC